jgi:hypothetical protein
MRQKNHDLDRRRNGADLDRSLRADAYPWGAIVLRLDDEALFEAAAILHHPEVPSSRSLSPRSMLRQRDGARRVAQKDPSRIPRRVYRIAATPMRR